MRDYAEQFERPGLTHRGQKSQHFLHERRRGRYSRTLIGHRQYNHQEANLGNIGVGFMVASGMNSVVLYCNNIIIIEAGKQVVIPF